MSKKKNTLKDLDEFLKQQAATLVTPTQLSDTISEAPPEKEKKTATAFEDVPEEVSVAKILNDLNTLAEKEGLSYRKKLYELIIQSLEAQKNSLPEDKMLINTALYLKNGDNWKEAIKLYWKSKNY
jgi:hypothetical protein